MKDSKKLSPKKRAVLREFIKENALAWQVAYSDVEEIERHNILQATIYAAHRGLHELSTRPQQILMDGSYFRMYWDKTTNKVVPHICIPKGDDTYMAIAAASILAKEAHDEWVLSVADEHPEYQWEKNKGYGSKVHREALVKYGPTPYHRPSFLTKILGT